MTAVTVTKKYVGFNGEFKEMAIKLSATPTSTNTYDTNMDVADGRGAEFSEIFSARFNTSDGTESVNCTWSVSTGIITIGTVSTPTATGFLHIRGK